MNNRYLFLLAWVQGSPTAARSGCADSRVFLQEDLMVQFKEGSEDMFALVINAPTQEIAEAVGKSGAFHENYTGEDTVSICVPITCQEKDICDSASFIGCGPYEEVTVQCTVPADNSG